MQRRAMLPIFDAAIRAVANVFGWLQKKEENYGVRHKNNETDEIRKKRDEEINYNADAVKYGVDPVTGRVRYPKDKQRN